MKKAFTKQGKEVLIQQLQFSDHDRLSDYLLQLQAATVKRFQPHAFNKPAIDHLFSNPAMIAIIAVDPSTHHIIGYTLLKKGYLEHDLPRFKQYGLHLQHIHCCTIAPSVADDWQGTGIGQLMFTYLFDELRTTTIHQMILWGGVQADNWPAKQFYLKNGFRVVGQFEYYGINEDMILEWS